MSVKTEYKFTGILQDYRPFYRESRDVLRRAKGRAKPAGFLSPDGHTALVPAEDGWRIYAYSDAVDIHDVAETEPTKKVGPFATTDDALGMLYLMKSFQEELDEEANPSEPQF